MDANDPAGLAAALLAAGIVAAAAGRWVFARLARHLADDFTAVA